MSDGWYFSLTSILLYFLQNVDTSHPREFCVRHLTSVVTFPRLEGFTPALHVAAFKDETARTQDSKVAC